MALADELVAHVVGGIIVFLAGITIGYFGLPFKNAQRIAVLEARLDALEETVKAVHSDLKQFMREWRNGGRNS